MSTIRRLTADYYHQALMKHGDTPRGVDWKDSAGQRFRFEQLLEGLPIDQPFSILDVGCGTGALVDFLSSRVQKTFRYDGIDFVAGMIEVAASKHQGRAQTRFLSTELREICEKYDFVVSSGIFNVKQTVSTIDWVSHCTETICEMFERCTKAIVFNCLTSRVDFRRDELFYSEPGFMLDFCQTNLSRYVRINHAYPLFEYTMTVYREEFIQGKA